MSDSLSERIANEIKTAMRARDSERLSSLRYLQAAIKQKEVDARKALSDAEVTAIIERQVKQRRESIDAFEKAGRTDSAQHEKNELAILQEFLPEAASQDEVNKVIETAVAQATEKGLSGGAAMGTVMGQVKQSLAGRVDMAAVSKQVREKLGM